MQRCSPIETECVFSHEDLFDWTKNLLVCVGVPADRAQVIADNLVAAELKGVPSHGLSRLGIYLKRLDQGLLDARAKLITLSERPSALSLDAQNAFGHAAAFEAMETAIEKARVSGACAVTVRNSTHFGRAGYFAEHAARQGLIAIVTTNSAARMAPWGGKQSVFGTNPLAVGIPANPQPIVLDMSTSVAALGKIMLAEKAGSDIPNNWALDAEGRPTASPSEALQGSLVPIAGPKGSGLAFVLDVLSGVLSGAGFGREVGSLYRDFTRPEGCGHFLLVFDVAAFMPLDSFKRSVSSYANLVRETAPIDSQAPVLVPGDFEQMVEARTRVTGVTLQVALRDELTSLSSAYRLDFPAPISKT